MERITVIDSHTAGEPTRVVVEGGPDLGAGPLASRRERFHREFDRYRSAIVNEPRGSDVIVGALLVPPEDRTCTTGVIYFNNVGVIGMCGHGTIGVVTTLAHLGRIKAGRHRIETPVGTVTTELHDDGEVSVTNVPSWRARASVSIEVEGVGPVTGDVAWGGNWFYLVPQPGEALALHDSAALTDRSRRIRRALNANGFPEVDHVELFGASPSGASARNFVLCPGDAYDRSPCGTGTSAKLACLAADGELGEGAPWVQESIVGTTFTASYRWIDRASGRIEPTIRGRAYVNAEGVQLLDPDDPFCWGIR
ncbi:MAG TPA: proline racemase family protein [Casimicrobiaceae bacterium]|nr:proline racemase family protein [Casimicrobiaceae bacterium]